MARETEAKIALAPGEIDVLRARLTALGGRAGSIDDEFNLVFDLKSEKGLKSAKGPKAAKGAKAGPRRRLRLRTCDGKPGALLTCKGPAAKDCDYKSRDEVEVYVSDAATTRLLLEQIGFKPRARYDKRREHWYVGDTVVALDRLVFGDFLEVEGEESAITATLALLGMEGRRHLRSGYARLSRVASKEPRRPPRPALERRRLAASA